jgi:hypothetical protein
MRKGFFLLIVIAALLVLSISIVNSSLTFTDYIINSSWLDVVGRWRHTQDLNYEIEFRQDGTFSEYYEGVEVEFGEYQPDGNYLILNYDPSRCGLANGTICEKRMRFEVGKATLVLKEGNRRMVFSRISE